MRLVPAPSFEPVSDRLHSRRPQVHGFRLSAASLTQNPQSLSQWIEIANTQLTDFVSPQSITPQQPEQSIITLAG